MPEYKRQHYVPRCYLRPFSLDQKGAALNLYNIAGSRAVQNAALKGQCAKDYIYGSNPDLEHALQQIESSYGRIIRLLQDGGSPTTEDLTFLRMFAHLQYSRTDMAVRRMRLQQEGMRNAIFDGRPVTPPDMDLSDRALMRDSIALFMDAREYIEDLRVCIVANRTKYDFVTSDDPAVFTSRYYVQKLGSNNFGLASSGALIFLPLTPRMVLLCYDGGVYTVSRAGCFLPVTSSNDVLAINELQYLKSAENIYFSNWADEVRVTKEFNAVATSRPEHWCTFSTFVEDGITERGQRYRLATDEERQTAQDTLLAMSTFHPAPSRWLSKLRYRSRPVVYNDGSAAGHVRPATLPLRDRN